MQFEYLDNPADIQALIDFHNEFSEFCVLDTETTSKNPREAVLIEVQMTGYDEDQAVMFDAKHLPLLAGLTCTQVWWNFKYDWKVCYRHGLDLRQSKMRDGMLMHHLLDENAPHDLDSIVQQEYADDYKEKFWAEFKSYQDAPLDRRLDYGCRDIVWTGRVYRTLLDRLAADRIPDSLVDHVHRLARALFDTELLGIAVDLDYTVAMGAELSVDIERNERELRELGGWHCEMLELEAWAKETDKEYKPGPRAKKWQTLPKPEFNFQAPGQVGALLYDRLGLPAAIDKFTKKRTVDDKTLEELQYLHPIVPRIRDLRKKSKMFGAFVDGVLSRQQGTRIYPSFNVNGTKTGRISHSDPNLGQMPSRGEWKKIRGIFIPDPGTCFISCDYGQLEVCVAAHFSQDPALLRMLREGISQHDLTAEGVGLPRSTAKTLNFAMQYLCGPSKVKEIVGCSDAKALQTWQKYWATYGGLKAFIDWCHKEMEAGRPVVNPFGRKRRFPGFVRPRWSNPAVGKYTSEDRQCFSSIIQGTGSDLTSFAAYLVNERLRERGWGRLSWTMHDELIAQAKRSVAEDAAKLIAATMLEVGEAMKLRVPLTVDCSQALDRWQK